MGYPLHASITRRALPDELDDLGRASFTS